MLLLLDHGWIKKKPEHTVGKHQPKGLVMKRVILLASVFVFSCLTIHVAEAKRFSCRSSCNSTTGQHMKHCMASAQVYCEQQSSVCTLNVEAKYAHCELLYTTCSRAAKEQCSLRCKTQRSCSLSCNSHYATYCKNRYTHCMARARKSFHQCDAKLYQGCQKRTRNSCAMRAGSYGKVCKRQCRRG